MIYIAMLLLAVIMLLERVNSRGVSSPAYILSLLWLAVLFCCLIFTNETSLSDSTILWVMAGVFSFFAGGITSSIFNFVKLPNYDVSAIKIEYLLPIYAAMFFLIARMFFSGAEVDSNWYKGIRIIINYGEPDIFFKAYGYLYYLLYPCLYLAAVARYSDMSNKKKKKSYHYQMLLCLIYAIMSTAKIKLLLIMIPIFFIRSYYIPLSKKTLLWAFVLFFSSFFMSLIALSKFSSGESISSGIISSIGNYSFANLIALDSLQGDIFSDNDCASTSGASCELLPFTNIEGYRTNIYTIIYDFISGPIFIYMAIQFLIGYFHSGLNHMARRSKNPAAVAISAIMFYPLIFQMINNSYTSSKYLLYIITIFYFFYILKRKAIRK